MREWLTVLIAVFGPVMKPMFLIFGIYAGLQVVDRLILLWVSVQ